VSDLAGLLEAVEQGEYPPVDLGVTHVPSPRPGSGAVLGFTGHIVVAVDLPPDWVATALPPGDPGAAFNPPFLGALEQALDLRVNNIDVLTLAPARSGPPEIALERINDHTHHRVRRAMRYRTDVSVWTCPGGVLTVGRGLAGRWEVGLEVDPDRRDHGLGRALAAAAAHLVPENRPVWAEIGVGNAASLRAFLAAGYRPVGQEALLVPRLT
jgi:GNAT superfamily N-acetyltransferase